jgi:transposase
VARIAPDWLKARVPSRWYERYAKKLDEYRLPDRATEREALAADIGQDGQTLLTWVSQPDTPEAVTNLPAIAVLRRVWHEQFIEQAGHLRWRTVSEVPRPGNAIASPHDPQARFRVKREVAWLGYQVHLTETCDEDLPHLIVQVETTVAAQTEFDALPAIHRQLAQHDLLPAHHLVDAGYASGQTLLDSQRAYQVDLVCPVPADHSWQARTAGAFDLTHFRIDWQHQHAICPMGNVSLPWRLLCPTKAPHQPVFFTRFRKADCAACPARARCTRGQSPRSLTILPQAEFDALRHARQRQQTEAFAQQYAKRAGIEGTLSQAVSRAGLRRSRYIGLAKTHLQHVLTAAALNIVRLVNWFNEVPRARTRVSHFAALAA